MKLISVEKMKALETAAHEGGYSYEKMMLQAGAGLAFIVHGAFYSENCCRVIGLVGGGNNGGDTLIALTGLQKLGWQTAVFMLKEDKNLKPLVIELHENGGKVVDFKALEDEVKEADVVLDGIFGTGFQPPMREATAQVLSLVAELAVDKVIVAVDCPSGVDCVTGEVASETLHANLTVCMQAAKEGMMKFPAFGYCGDLIAVDLGIPKKYLKSYENGDVVVDDEFSYGLMPNRLVDSHKGSFGHLLVCGGSVNYPGAPMLAATAAYRAGTGLVECALPGRIYEASVPGHGECIYTILEDEDGVIAEGAAATLTKKLSGATALLLGPGIGREEPTFRFLQRLLSGANGKSQAAGAGFVPGAAKKGEKSIDALPPMVVDADGLRLLLRIEHWYEKLPANCVLTPHPGEMAALTGLTVEKIQSDRWEIAKKFAAQWNKTVVLKGALTVVAAPDGRKAIVPYASSVLAKAGTGDVLAGIIAGFLAQGVKAFDAAVLGAWVHARAAEQFQIHQGERSLLAGDLIDALPSVLLHLE